MNYQLIFVTLCGILGTTTGMAQGLIRFANRDSGGVDARVFLPDGTGVGAGFVAQLSLVTSHNIVPVLTPLLPTTTFFDSTPAARGYVHPVNVSVPGILGGQSVGVIMRVFEGESWESSTFRGESSVATVELVPPEFGTGGLLTGLRQFIVAPIPEPGTLAMTICGIAVLAGAMRLLRPA